jgi:hypothetical protein
MTDGNDNPTLPQVRRLINLALEPETAATGDRPTGVRIGTSIFDTTLGIPVWWDGSDWVSADGTVV